MNCRTVRSLTSAYLEEEVTAEEHDGIDEHLQSCSRCSVSLFQTSRVTSLLADLPRVPASVGFTDRVLLRVAEIEAAERRAWRPLRVLKLRWPELPPLRIPGAVWAPGLAAAAVMLAFAGGRGVLVPLKAVRTPVTAPVTAHVDPPATSTISSPSAPAAIDRATSVAATAGPVSSGSRTTAGSSPGVRTATEFAAAPAANRTAPARGAVRTRDESANPLADVQAVGPGGFALQGHDVLDPATDIDLIYEQVSPERAGLVQRAGALVPGGTPAKRRYWTF